MQGPDMMVGTDLENKTLKNDLVPILRIIARPVTTPRI